MPWNWSKSGFRRLPVLLLAAGGLLADSNQSRAGTEGPLVVAGRVENVPLATHLFVRAASIDIAIEEEFEVNAVGDFRLEIPRPGNYDVRVLDDFHNVIWHQSMYLFAATRLVIRIPDTAKDRPANEAVSVNELARKIPDKAIRESNLGAEAFARGEYEKAMEHQRRALKLFPGFAEAHNRLGRCLLKLDQAEPAMSEFRQAASLDPASPAPISNLAIALAAAGRFAEAEQSARAALRMRPNLIPARFILGFALFHQQMYGAETLENLLSATGQFQLARLLAAKTLAKLGRNREAAQELERYLKSAEVGPERAALEAWLAVLGGRAQN